MAINPAPLYDDSYTGPRYTYGLTYRPLAKAQVPDGWILWSDRKSADFRHGTVDYPVRLSDEMVAAFQLTEVAAYPPGPERTATMATTVQAPAPGATVDTNVHAARIYPDLTTRRAAVLKLSPSKWLPLRVVHLTVHLTRNGGYWAGLAPEATVTGAPLPTLRQAMRAARAAA